jgi:bacillithiol biosynthesis deacetylase BshB1
MRIGFTGIECSKLFEVCGFWFVVPRLAKKLKSTNWYFSVLSFSLSYYNRSFSSHNLKPQTSPMFKLDILAIASHPDDVELCAAGTLMAHISKGYKCGIVDLTRGELGTRGNAEKRLAEAKKAAEIMGLSVRENLEMEDGFFLNDKAHQLAIATVIRKYKPEIVISNSISDRHPDHGRAAALVTNAVFLAGLARLSTTSAGQPQEKWKVKAHYHCIQDRYIKPDFVIDVTPYWEKKMEAILAYKTQFFDPTNNEPNTPISGKEFLDFLSARAMEFGRPAGYHYAEGFTVERTPGVSDFFTLE